MTRPRTARPLLGALATALCACSDPTPAAPDATVPRDAAADLPALPDGLAAPTTTLELRDGRAVYALAAAPLRLSVRHLDGAPWFASPPATPLIEIGTRAGASSPTHFSDPRVHDPPDITWVSPSRVTDARTPSPDARAVTLAGGDGDALTATLALTPQGATLTVDACATREAAMIRVNLATDDGGYHGLGERFGHVDARGEVVPMQLHLDTRVASGTNEAHVPVPFVVSTRAYGMFVETREAGAFDVGATDPSTLSATFEGCRATVHLYADASPVRVIADYTLDAGGARTPPPWVFGPMHWRNEWANAEQALEDARRIRAEHIPVSTLWIDNPWEDSYNSHAFDTRRFPDPPALLRELARMGFKVLLWSTPYLDAVAPGATPANTAERLFVQARDQHWLLTLSDGSPFVSPANPGSAGGMGDSRGALVDFSSTPARNFWTSRVAPLVAMGVRGFKLDYGEDVIPEIAGARPRIQFSTGETERTGGRLYPQGYHQAYRDAFDQASMGEGFLLVRASSYGGQRIADVVWPGDLDNDFRRHEGAQVGGLPAAVHALQTLSCSGFPAFGSDTGGYRGGRPTREVLLRWAEHTALSPVMQLGGGGDNHNPWSYDADATETYRALARLHNDLVPYFRLLAAGAARDGTPTVRPLAIEFPSDPAARDEDAYTLGDDLLVAPVVEAGATTRRVHIPPGTWVHWFDGTAHTGPTDVTVPAPIGRPALFMRQGAVIPMMASDIDTLSATDDPAVVDETDRATILRARAIPAGDAATAGVAVHESAAALTVTFAPTAPVDELRIEIDLRHRANPSSTVSAVTRATGDALTRADAPAALSAGCRDCWNYDPTTGWLRVNVRGAATLSVTP